MPNPTHSLIIVAQAAPLIPIPKEPINRKSRPALTTRVTNIDKVTRCGLPSLLANKHSTTIGAWTMKAASITLT